VSVDPRWSSPDAVRGFVQSPPNQTLLRFAAQERVRCGPVARVLDIGCGAGRNARPLADEGWYVCGLDTSWPMLAAAAERRVPRLQLAQATMSDLPIADATCDLVIAHGIWNLATSDVMFRRAVADAARVARPGAALFVFTFSRHTLPPQAAPLAGETLTFDQFAGVPQIFLTSNQLTDELARAGFDTDPAVPLREHNRPSGAMLASTVPVIYEGGFRRRA
jgi:SAM-dependent methyltransferase